MIGVAGSSSSVEFMQEFVDETGVGGFSHIADVDNEIWQRFGVRTQPTFVFIDDDGSTETSRGLGQAGLAERIDELLAS